MGFKAKLFGTALAFGAGFFTNYYISPATTEEHLAKIQEDINKAPRANIELIEEGIEYFHDVKAQTVPGSPMEGHWQYNALRLELVDGSEGNYTLLVNRLTNEKLPVKNVAGKTAVGDLTTRLNLMAHEIVQGGSTIIEETKEVYQSQKKEGSKTQKAYDWLKDKCPGYETMQTPDSLRTHN